MTDHSIDSLADAGPGLVFLAPPRTGACPQLPCARVDTPRYENLLARMQRLRGSIYLGDGAIGPDQLLPDGRHVVPADDRSWHVLWLGAGGKVTGCARYEQHRLPVSFQTLGVGQSALAHHAHWGLKLRNAVQTAVTAAQERRCHFVEVGGWAVDEPARLTPIALRIALATFALARVLGGCIGVTTATVRHCSAEILRRLGGRALESPEGAIPRYFDPMYKCQMEILSFDSSQPSPKFRPWIDSLANRLAGVPVFSPAANPEAGIPHPVVFDSAGGPGFLRTLAAPPRTVYTELQ